ncbi:ead/Ea22-like family protein [Franconibacter helveticus]|uniref:ead/Ea22-like family protein n=1 Tax=Franconibacter helveticus TaxID=357240 RepID=UPI000A955903|nr:ead/Ea22-like family protein [Franconibacter helveticus]
MQLNVMPLSELLTTANNYATSIKELGIYSDLVKELCNRLDAGSLAMRELTKQRDALATENANARNAVQAFCDVVGANTDAICEEVGRDGVQVILAAMKATGNMPATDAFLAEVRAQGAESAAAHIKQHIQHIPDDLRVTYHDAIELCSGAAAELRKGGAA